MTIPIEKKAEVVQDLLFQKALSQKKERGKIIEALINAHALITLFTPVQIEVLIEDINAEEIGEEHAEAKKLVINRLKSFISAHEILKQV